MSDHSGYTLPALSGKSCNLFPPTNSVRLFLLKILYSKPGEIVAQVLIVVSILCYTMERPTVKEDDKTTYDKVLDILDIVFTIIFTIELCLRLFIESFKVYWSSKWNRLDASVIVLNWIPVILSGSVSKSPLRGFRAFRALRPLLALRYMEGIQAILYSLSRSASMVVDVLGVMGFFFLIFGVLGIQLYSGAYRRRCVVAGEGSLPEPGDFCRVDASSEWEGYTCDPSQICDDSFGNPNYGFTSFDNIGSAFLTIFISSTLEGWVDFMYWAMDSSMLLSWIYFVLLVVFVSFLVVNLFVAVISDTFSDVRKEAREKGEETSAFTKGPREFLPPPGMNDSESEERMDDVEAGHVLGKRKSAAVGCCGRFGRSVYILCERIINHPYFERFIMVVIVLNTVSLATEHHGMSEEHRTVLDVLEIIFVCIYVVEFILKVIGLGGFRNYWKQPVNRFDFTILIISIIGLFTVSMSSLRTLRLLRPLRLVRLMVLQGQLRQLLDTIFGSMGAIANLLTFIALSLLVFGIMGMDLFGGSFPRSDDGEIPRANFDDFGQSVLTLFQVMSGENWTDPLFDGMVGVSSWIAPIYFIIFFVFSGYILLNLFVAVILENFEIKEEEKMDRQKEIYSKLEKRKAVKSVASTSQKKNRHTRGNTIFGSGLSKIVDRLSIPERHHHVTSSGVEDVMTDESGRRTSEISSKKDSYSDINSESASPAFSKSTDLLADVHEGSTPSKEVVDEKNSSGKKWSVKDGEDRDSLPSSIVLKKEDEEDVSDVSEDIEKKEDEEDVTVVSEDIEKKEDDKVEESIIISHERIDDKKDDEIHSSSLKKIEDVEIKVSIESSDVKKTEEGEDVIMSENLKKDLRCIVTQTDTLDVTKPPKSPKSPALPEVARRAELLYADTLNGAKVTAAKSQKEREETVHTTVQSSAPDSIPKAERRKSDGKKKKAVLEALGVEDDKPTRALLCLEANNPIRVFCKTVVVHKWFDRVILLAILCSSVVLALEGPPEQDKSSDRKSFNNIFFVFDVIFVSIFGVEFLLKMIAHGLLFTKNAYLRDGFNIMDFVVLVVSFALLFLNSSVSGGARALRVLRAVRPLRLLNKNPSMKMIVLSIWLSIPALLYVVLLTVLIILLFAIIGLGLFSGKFYRCNDDSMSGMDSCVGTFALDDVVVPRVWENPPYSFDNVYQGFMTLLEMASLEGWVGVMYDGMDVTEVDKQPERNNSWVMALYFVAFVVVAVFFVLQLFIGVFCDQFNRFRGTALLTEEQRTWVNLQRTMLHMKPLRVYDPPERKSRRKVYTFVTSRRFEWFILVCIIINIVLMATEHYDQPGYWTTVLEMMNYVFVSIFFIEMVLKMYAFGPREYFRSSWNVFDFLIVVGSIVAIIIELASSSDSVSIGFARVFRIFRIFRLVSGAAGLRFILQTLIISLPSLGNVAMLFFLMIFVYAVTGVQLYGNVRFQGSLDRNANFRSFPSAFLVLFRMTTGENWQNLQYDCMIDAPLCTSTEEYDDCGDPWSARFYFISFFVIANFMFLNLIIGLVVDNFQFSTCDDGSSVSKEDLEKFRSVWGMESFDSQSTGKIPLDKVTDLLFAIGEPLGFSYVDDSNRDRYQRIHVEASEKAEEFKGQIPFRQMIHILATNAVPLDLMEYGRRQERERRLENIRIKVAAARLARAMSVKQTNFLSVVSKLRTRNTEETTEMKNVVESDEKCSRE